MIDLSGITQKASKLIADNSAGILTGVGVIGTVAVGVLTARATFKAAEIIREEAAMKEMKEPGSADLTKTEKAKKVWPQYIPPVVAGAATIASIIFANRMNARRAAALAAAYGISETRFQEYRDKITEKLGINKERDARDELAQDRVNRKPPHKEVIILAGGDVLCFDQLTGRYFRSTVEDIRKAENKINQELFLHQYASLSHFYEIVGLPPTSFSEEVGWNLISDRPFEVKFSTVMSPDQQPCLAIDFADPPNPNYTQLY